MGRPVANAPLAPTVATLTEWPKTPSGHFDSPGQEEWRKRFIREWRNLGVILMQQGATLAHVSLAEDLAEVIVTIARMRARNDPERNVTNKERIRADLKRLLFAAALARATPPATTPQTGGPAARAFPSRQ